MNSHGIVSRTNHVGRNISKYKYIYIMAIPVMLYYIMFHYTPMYGMVIAFKDYNVIRGIWNSSWVGLKHFNQIFNDDYFWKVFSNTLIISTMKLIFAFPFPIFLALMINEIMNVKFKRVVQTIIYLPHFISWVVIGGIIINFLSVDYGVVNNIIEFFGGNRIHFLARKDYFKAILVVSFIWRSAGYGTIIYIAALTSINPELYEAAIVDGANRWRQIWNITIPSIRPTIVVMFILNLSRVLDAGFEQVFVLLNPIVRETGDIIDTYVYRSAIQLGRYSYASAVGMFKSVIAFILILSADKFFKKIGERGII